MTLQGIPSCFPPIAYPYVSLLSFLSPTSFRKMFPLPLRDASRMHLVVCFRCEGDPRARLLGSQ